MCARPLFPLIVLLSQLGCQVFPSAHGEPIVLIELDTGDSEAPDSTRNPWPFLTLVDTERAQIRLFWDDSNDSESIETLALDEVRRIERARNFGDLPDELFLQLIDERRILVSRGADVETQMILLQSWLTQPLVTLAPGEGHIDPSNHPDLPTPRLVFDTAEGQLHMEALERSESASSSPTSGDDSEPRTLTGNIEDQLRANLDHSIRNRLERIRNCYLNRHENDRERQGDVLMEVTIAENGQIQSATTIESSLSDPRVEQCLSNELMRIVISNPEGATVTLRYPFSFYTE